jgi:photosystem II stability/assembly factor-like uncharacterized protein
MQRQLWLALAMALFGCLNYSAAQDDSKDATQQLIDFHQFRQIGPFRGGRSAAVAGVPGKPMVAYQGAAGGGVWKTEDGGSNWRNITDGFFGGSVGAVEVSSSDPNTIYVGGGEVTVRGNVSHGYGIWKTIDGGKTWEHKGMEDSRRIPRIRIDSKDPNIVYAAVLGHLFGPNQERGVYKSTDGGDTWKRTLFVNEEVGACDLIIDPNNPRILYASTWRILRTPYSLESGGDGCGLWKSTDGGETWNEISRNRGLPKGSLGIIGVTVSPVDSNRVWAIIEADDGGLFRSDNGGESWTRINDERKLRQRAWYYSRIYAGPDNIDEVYCVNVRFWRSTDGGKTFGSIRTPHGDHHDLWIDPADPDHFVVADDGGAQVTFNRGETFSTYMNQPTAQFYRVTTDNHFPYRIYGAQQDNSTVRISSRGSRGGIGERDWESTAGGESGHIAPHPENPDIVYGGSYGGLLTRINHKTGERRNINVWPDNPMGHGAGDGKYRFQWNFPIFFSPHDSGTLYTAGNVLFKTTDEGASWTAISPDLTRNDPTKLGPSGGPITKDNTGVEYYCTIFAAAESQHEAGTIWCGSDDGLLHISRDAGENWEDVTPPDLPEWAQINSIEVHPTEAGGLYVAATRYKLDDFKPYLYKTLDYGKTWKLITNGIDRKHFTRVVRADPDRAGLLYAGTETELYLSFDDGENWRSFQCNVPITPITDLTIKDGDLIVATQGRSFWVLDDLTLLHQWNNDVPESELTMFQTRPTYRMGGGSGRASLTTGTSVRGGVGMKFFAKEELGKNAKATLTITDPNGNIATKYSSKPKDGETKLNIKKGLNEIVWNMSYPGAETFEGMVLWAGGTGGPRAVPGTYTARMSVKSGENEVVQEKQFELLKDPRASATQEDLQAQFDFQIEVREKLTETHSAIKKVRDLRSQLTAFKKRIGDKEDFKKLGEQAQTLIDEMTAVEKELYQTKNQSAQDPLNYPIKLNNRLSALVGVVASGDNAPTAQSIAVRDELVGLIDEQLEKLTTIFETGVAEFNDAVDAAKVPAIFIED